MSGIVVEGLPKLRFAHTYAAPKYKNVIQRESNGIELSYLAQGRLILRKGEKEQAAEKGDVICFLHDQPVYIESDVPHEHHTVCFSLPFSFAKEGGTEFTLVTKACAATKKVETLIDDAIRTFSLDSRREFLLASFIMQALDIITSCRADRAEISYGNARYTEKAKQYIYANLHRNVRQKEVAEYLGVSAQYLCTLFKKTEGVSVISFINRMKLEKIKSLMTKENLKLYEAAELFGYSDPNYVSKLYKQTFHVNITQE